MTRFSPRGVFALLTCALLTASCDLIPKPSGECTGTHLGQSVAWPITLNSTHSGLSDMDGSQRALINLNYTPQNVQGLPSFGADIILTSETQFEAGSPRTVKLLLQQDRLVPEETSLVLRWEGKTSPGGSAYLTPPGVPMEGSVTLNQVTPDHAEGQFVYRYTDGGVLTCTFDVPDRIYDDGDDSDWGGGGDDDDDD
ncbi:MAG TPA: hypothetical protein VF815_25450 [Myxococcaceae bacterium]|jgi:hypothetical protein